MIAPEISVIIPNYNKDKWIGEAIKSALLNKKHISNIEIVIVDDKSTDNSREIIKSYKKEDSCIKTILLNENRGVSYARNIGINESKGKYMALLDSDDMFTENSLITMLTSFKLIEQEIGDIVLLMGDATLINEQGYPCGRYMKRNFQDKLMINNTSLENLKKIESDLHSKAKDGDPPHWCIQSGFFFKKNNIRFYENYKAGEGLLFLKQMESVGNVAYLGIPLVKYRLCKSSLTNALASECMKSIKATKMSIKEGRLLNPINPDEVSINILELLNWKEGRNAKVAYCNKQYFTAAKSFIVAACSNPYNTYKKIRK